ncbi:hypothetical protein GDO81_026592 [Engystomops pustulosus]|uniref:Uncharacterized protein n=1 Tax=Engystomops pustulosus TaxID=76066 RepID=A0AAV6Z2D4_ENGPU|nr:hypothetical protein GDO81_026592 [Engystomops pustulosus]
MTLGPGTPRMVRTDGLISHYFLELIPPLFPFLLLVSTSPKCVQEPDQCPQYLGTIVKVEQHCEGGD